MLSPIFIFCNIYKNLIIIIHITTNKVNIMVLSLNYICKINSSFSTLLFPPLNVTLFLVATPVHGVRLRKTFGVMVSSADQFRYCSLDTHSQNRTFRASLLRNFVLFMNGHPLRPADLSNFYASMKFVQI